MRLPLRCWTLRFVRLKRRLGHKYAAFEARLRSLDRWLAGHGVRRLTQVTPELLREWFALRSTQIGRSTLAHQISAVRLLFQFVHSRGHLPHDPAAALPVVRPPQYLPFVFSVGELRTLLADGPTVFRGPATRSVYATLFHLLYATGLRISETLRLKLADLDLEERLLRVRRTKFFKSRLVPLGPRICDKLRRYLTARSDAADAPRPAAYVFAPARRSTVARPLSYAAARGAFRRMLRHTGLDRPRREHPGRVYAQPHVHSLRHTFAVHRLQKWYEEGHDVNAKLPLLSTYLGHSNVAHTQVYLAVSNVVLAQADRRVKELLAPGDPS